MKSQRQFSVCLCSVSILITILASASYVVPAKAAIASVSVVPSSLTTGISQDFNIDIAVSNVLDLYGWEFVLSWNTTVLNAVNVVEGSFLNSGGRQTFFSNITDSVGGTMVVDCTLLGVISGVSGSGTLSTVTFYARNFGNCPLNLYNVSLIDSSEQSISCQTTSGYWQAIPPHDISVTHVDASPMILLPGGIVGINATVQNQGGFVEIFNVTTYANARLVGTQQISLNSSSQTTVLFAWNTTGAGKGDYVILASAGPVPGETHTSDNNKTADSIVTILTQGHDVAVTHVGPNKTVIGQGFSFNVSVTVKNYGVYSETFNVTARVNSTAFGTRTVTLASGENAGLVFLKNALGMTYGNYTLSASASVVPGEIDTSDNNVTDGLILVTIPGDTNGDGRVDIYDAIMISNAFNSVPGTPDWNANADINSNNVVDVYDAILLANNFGKTAF